MPQAVLVVAFAKIDQGLQHENQGSRLCSLTLTLFQVVQVVLSLIELSLCNIVVGLGGPGLLGRGLNAVGHVQILVALLEPLLVEVAGSLDGADLVKVERKGVHARYAVVTCVEKMRVRPLVVAGECGREYGCEVLLLIRFVIHQLT